MRAELATIRRLTTRPFNVNSFCHQPPAPCADRETIWRTALSPYFADLFTGRPARGIVNRLMREIGPMSAAAPPFPLAASAIAAMRAPAERLGRDDFSPLWAGQNTRGCKAIPAAALTLELARSFATASRGT